MAITGANTNSTGAYKSQTGDVISSTATKSNISKKYIPNDPSYGKQDNFDVLTAQTMLREQQANAAEQDANLAGELPDNSVFLADNDPMAFDDTITTGVSGPNFDVKPTVDPIFGQQFEEFGESLQAAGAYGETGTLAQQTKNEVKAKWMAGEYGRVSWQVAWADYQKANPVYTGYENIDTSNWTSGKNEFNKIQEQYLGLTPQTVNAVQLEKDLQAQKERIEKREAGEEVASPESIPDIKTNFMDYTFRGSNTENSLRQQNLDIKYYKVNFDNEYIKEDGTVRKDLAWSPEAQRGYNPQDYINKTLFNPTSAYTTGTDASGKQAQTSTKFRTSFPATASTPENKQEMANYLNMTIPGSENNELDYFPGEASDANPDGGQLKEYAPEFDNPKGGPTWVDTSDLDRVYGAGQGKAGFEKQINKQNANRAYKTIIGEWQSGFLTGGGSQSKAKSFVDKKISLMDSWGGKDNDLGGYKNMFKKDIKSRYTNLYGMYSPANNTTPVDKYTSFKSVFNDGKVTASTRVKDDRLTNAVGLAMNNNPMDSYTKQLKNSTKTWKDYY